MEPVSETIIKFKQRSFLETRVFHLYEDRIKVSECKGFSQLEYTRSFESIFDGRIKYKQFPKVSFVGMIAVLIIEVVLAYILRSDIDLFVVPAILFGILFLCFAVNYCFTYRKYIGYDTEAKPILFLINRPSKDELELFLDAFESRKKQYIFEQYGYVETKGEISNELQRLYWLKERSALTEEEYIKAKEKILGDKPSSGMLYPNRFN